MKREMCFWHSTGVPQWACEMRFFAQGCRECARKVVDGVVSETDPSPETLREAQKLKKTKQSFAEIEWRRKQAAARRVYFAEHGGV